MAARRLSPLLGARLGASDVLQEAFAQLLRTPPRMDATSLRGSDWLDAVVNNMVRRAVEWHWKTAQRSAKREVHDSGIVSNLPARSTEQTPSAEAVRHEEISRTNLAIASLEEDDRVVVRLRTWDELTFAEIAAIVGKTEAAVRMQYRRALVKLHGLLNDDGRPEP